MIEYQIGGVHVSVLPIRGGHFVPGGICFRDYLHGQGVFVGREDLIVPAGTST